MKVVILAGGFGTRLSEETIVKPKPMVDIGGMPILWHIMKTYSYFGFNEFIICLGYKGYVIKEFFHNYFLHKSDVTIDLATNNHEYHNRKAETWKVSLINTGENTMTGGRILRIKDYIRDDKFLLTYGDGLSTININDLVKYHDGHEQMVTLTAAQPKGRFGALKIDKNHKVKSFKEKPEGDSSWVNAGFFVCNRGVFDYIKDDSTVFEREPLEKLAEEDQLASYLHDGFWMPMDKLSDKNELEKMWKDKKAPWKTW